MSQQGALYAFYRGLIDSVMGPCLIMKIDKNLSERAAAKRRLNKSSGRISTSPKEEIKVSERITQIYILNGCIFLPSVLLFNYLMLPIISKFTSVYISKWLQILLTFLFQTGWVLPLFLLSRAMNSLWLQDVSNLAFLHSHGKRPAFGNISLFLSDLFINIFVQWIFVVQALLVQYIPVVGDIMYILHMSFYYSLYAFEYRLASLQWMLIKRLDFIEKHWPYMIGFGLPLTLVTYFMEWQVSICVVPLSVPLYMLSAYMANPVDGRVPPLKLFAPSMSVVNLISSLYFPLKTTPSGSNQR